MKRILLAFTCLFGIAVNSNAYDFQVDNLRYTILSTTDHTVEVMKSSESMSGNVVIPQIVTYNGVDFTVTSIAKEGFAYCHDIKTFTFPSSLIKIKELGLGWCWYLNTIILDNPSSSFSYGSSAFDYDWRAFESVNIITGDEKEMLNNGVGMLAYLPLHDLYINGERVTNFVVPEETESINTFFYNCKSLKTLTLSSSVKHITSKAFYHCDSLETIHLSNNIQTIGANAFKDCASLRTIYSPSYEPASIVSSTFPNGAYMFATVYIPKGTLSRYQNASGWSNFSNFVETEELGSLNIIEVISNNDQYGTVTGGGVYKFGEIATITAEPNKGCTFLRWSDGSQENLRNIVVTQDSTLIAYFEEGERKDVTILFSNGNDGTELLSYSVNLQVPRAPEIGGFTFLYWQPVAVPISDTITIQAIYESNSPAAAPEVYVNPANPAQKLIRNGHVYILYEDKEYTVLGQIAR